MKAIFIDRISQLRIDKFTLLLAALSVFGTLLVLLRGVTYGASVTSLSIDFISTARNLLAGNGFTPWNGGSYILYPPLFPLLLAFIGIFGPDPADTAGYVNAFLFGLTIFLSSRWLQQYILPPHDPTWRAIRTWLLIWAGAALGLSLPLTIVASRVLSEPLFILLTTSSLFAFDKFLHTGKRSSLTLSAIFTALACLTRYLGLAIPATMLLLLLCRRDATPLTKAKDAALYALISGIPISVWFLRNFLVAGTLARRYLYPSMYSLPFNLHATFVTLADWVLPRPWLMTMAKQLAWLFSVEVTRKSLVVLMIPTLLVLGMGAWYCLSPVQRHHVRPICILATFTSVYVVLLTSGISAHGVEPANNRYLAPVYIPLLFIAVLVLDEFFRDDMKRQILGTITFTWPQNSRAGVAGTLTVVLMLWLSFWLWDQKDINAWNIRNMIVDGYGYTSRKWADSEIIRYIKENPCGRCVIWSNHARALYFHIKHPHRRMHQLMDTDDGPVPRSIYFLSEQPIQFHNLPRQVMDDGPRQVKHIQRNGDEVYIVWFHENEFRNRFPYSPLELETWLELEVVAERSDAILYRVKQ